MGLDHGDVLGSFPEGVFLINTRWQIGYFNRTAEQITGFRREEVLASSAGISFKAICATRIAPCGSP